jgi:hypothetical protein
VKRICLTFAIALGATLLGCGESNTIILPTDKLTPEQEAKVKLEDANVDDEESQGKKKKKK